MPTAVSQLQATNWLMDNGPKQLEAAVPGDRLSTQCTHPDRRQRSALPGRQFRAPASSWVSRERNHWP